MIRVIVKFLLGLIFINYLLGNNIDFTKFKILKMLEIIKKLDVFGYRPQFLVSGNQKFKSIAGGLIFIAFFVFAIYYVVSQTVEYVKKYDFVSNSRIVLIDSESYNISIPEMYFGIGIISDSHLEYNITSEFPYLEFILSSTYIDRNGNRADDYISLSPCEINYFYDDINNNVHFKGKREVFTNRLKYYYCLPKNFTYESLAFDFGEEESYIQIIVSINNSSLLNYAQQHINRIRPKINFIFKNILIDTEDKYSPYSSNIETFHNVIDYDFFKKTELYLNPFEIFDDRNYFGNSEHLPVRNDISKQRQFTVFQITRSTNIFEHISDRISSQNLEVFKFKLNLNRSVNRCYRSYNKFSVFLAEVSAALSNLLFILAVIMIEYNAYHGPNDLIFTLFNNEKLQNMKLFTKDLKKKILKKSTNVENECLRKSNNNKIKTIIPRDNHTLKSIFFLYRKFII